MSDDDNDFILAAERRELANTGGSLTKEQARAIAAGAIGGPEDGASKLVEQRSSDVSYDEIARAYPEPKIVCRSVQIYGPLINGGRRGRIVITEDLDPRYVKLVITEPEPNAKGYRSASLLVDARGFEGLQAAFNSTGLAGRIPYPSQWDGGPDRLDLVADDVRRAAWAIDQARMPGESFEDAVVRLRSAAISQFPKEQRATDPGPRSVRLTNLEPEPADLRTVRPRGYEGPEF